MPEKETVVEKTPSEAVAKKAEEKPSGNKNTIVTKVEITETEENALILDTVEDAAAEASDAETEPEIEIPLIEKREPSTVYIPSTKSLFKKTDVSVYRLHTQARISSVQRERLRIDEVKTGIPMKEIPSEDLLPGQSYYSGENGRLESFIYLEPKGKIHEYLLSFDPKGNYVDCIEIGLIGSEDEKIKYAGLQTNKILVFEVQTNSAINRKEEIVTQYTVNSHLQFKKGKTFTKLL
ncbi:MAG: hypothetical protein LBH61_00605 [Dysgonamonadaceae bacterium]|jgi:hypothetical protein|nr:hypothetical protein [Dysgonamonadaceae bacterium]